MDIRFLDPGMNVKRGDDSTPLVSLVSDPPPSHWGKITSQSRTSCPQYIKFLKRKDAKDGRTS
jgi:hypothetical protein